MSTETIVNNIVFLLALTLIFMALDIFFDKESRKQPTQVMRALLLMAFGFFLMSFSAVMYGSRNSGQAAANNYYRKLAASEYPAV